MAEIFEQEEIRKRRSKDSYVGHSSGRGGANKDFDVASGWGGSGNVVMDTIHNSGGYKQAVMSVTSFGTSKGQSSAFIDYMSQADSIDLFTEEKNKLSLDKAKNKISEWVESTKKRKGSNRFTMHLMLSGDEKLDRDEMETVTQSFLNKSFKNHESIFAIHTDKNLIHSHVSIKMAGLNNKKIPANKSDLRKWRSEYAEVLRDHGVKASSTSRLSRGLFGRSSPPGLKIVKEIYGKKIHSSYERKYDQQWMDKWSEVYRDIGEKFLKSNDSNLITQGEKIIQLKEHVSSKGTQQQNDSMES